MSKSSKRINGSGTVYFDKSRKRYRVQYFDLNGVRRGISGRTRAEAEKALRTALHLRDTNQLPPPQKHVDSVACFLDQWLETNAHDWEFKTREQNRGDVERHIKPVIGTKKLSQVTAEEIENFYSKLRTEKGLGAHSVLRIHTTLASAFKRAARLKKIPFNPMDSVQRPLVKETEFDALKLVLVCRLFCHVVSKRRISHQISRSGHRQICSRMRVPNPVHCKSRIRGDLQVLFRKGRFLRSHG